MPQNDTGPSPNGRNRRKEAAALALAAGNSVREAAEKVAVGERTIFRWLEKPSFQQRIVEIRSGLFTAAVEKLTSLAGQAVNVLGDLLDCGSPKIRMDAAKFILGVIGELRENVTFGGRLQAVERMFHHYETTKQKTAFIPGGPSGPASATAGAVVRQLTIGPAPQNLGNFDNNQQAPWASG